MRYQSEIEAIILHVALIHFTELFQWNSFILLKDYKVLSIWRCSASERDRHPIVLGTQRMIATRMCSAPEVLAPPRCLPPTKRKKMNQGGYVTNGAYSHYSFPPDPDHIFNSWIIVLYSDGTFTLRKFLKKCSTSPWINQFGRWVTIKPLTPKISSVILFTNCCTVCMILVLRICYWINW